MKRKEIAKIIMCTLILTSLTGNIVYAADNNISKEEVIYAVLDEKGKVSNEYVINSFLLDNDTNVVDYGDYSNIKNLASTDKIEHSNDTISFNAKKGKYYYQGYLENAELPWDISIKYFLDNKEIQEDELAGKSGDLSIKIDINKNNNVDQSFFENYALQISLTLDGEKASNIVADGATIANVGSNKSLTYIQLPGNEASYEIKAKIENFEMDPISINGILMGIDIDVDETYLMDAFKELTDGVSTLQSGSTKLRSGSVEYKEGVNTFANQTSLLLNASSNLTSGIGQLNNGIVAVNDGAIKLNNGLETLAEGSSVYNKNLKDFASATKPLKNTTNDIMSEKKNVDDIVLDSFEKISSGNKNAIEELKAVKANLEELKKTLTPEEIKKYKINELLKITSTLLENANKISNNHESVVGNYKDLSKGLDDYLGGVNSTIDGVESLAKNYDNIDSGIQSAKEGSKTLKEGTKDLKKGSSELSNGGNIMNGAIKSFDDGSNEILKGAETLDGGIETLNNGIIKLKSGTDGIDGQVNSKIDEMISKYTAKGYKVKSFVSEKNENVNSVQFVMRTNGIEIKEEKELEQKEDTKESFIDKLINLFVK